MPRVRLILSLGRPDPDLFTTMLLWSLLGHIGLLIGALIYHSLPSGPQLSPKAFYVRLAGTPAPPAGGGSARPAPSRPAEPAVKAAPARPEPVPKPSAKPAPPSHTIMPADKPPRPSPRAAEAPAGPTAEKGAPEPGGAAPPGPPSGVAGEGAGSAPGGPGAPGIGATSFGEGDFEFGWYQSAIEAKLESNWRRPISTSAEVEVVTVSFVIRRDGLVEGVQITAPSGNSALDLSVLRAVYDSNRLPALPKAWSGDSVHVTMEFRLTPAGEP